MKTIKSLLAIVATVALTSTALAGEYADLSVDQLHQAIKDKSVVVIDVNGSKSFENGRIPGAIDFASVKDLSSVLPKDKNTKIVAYCGGPKCMAYKKAAMAAKDLGYKNVMHLSAGISGWKDAGKPVETGKSS